MAVDTATIASRGSDFDNGARADFQCTKDACEWGWGRNSRHNPRVYAGSASDATVSEGIGEAGCEQSSFILSHSGASLA